MDLHITNITYDHKSDKYAARISLKDGEKVIDIDHLALSNAEFAALDWVVQRVQKEAEG